MRRFPSAFLAALAACAPPGPVGDFTLRLGVLGPVGEIRPRASTGAAALVSDLVFQSLAVPGPGGWSSPVLRRWERIGVRRWRVEVLEGLRLSDGSAVVLGDVAAVLRAEGCTVREIGAALEVETPAGQPMEVVLATTGLVRRTAAGYLGTAPFAVESQTPERTVLRRTVPAPDRVARVELVACRDAREAFTRLLRGELNGMVPIDRVLSELLDGVPGIRVVRGNSPSAVVVRFGPRLTAAERQALAAAMPAPEIAAAVKREACCAEPLPVRPPLVDGRPLSIVYPSNIAALGRAALSLRQGLGPQGGEIASVEAADLVRRASGFDLQLVTMLVRPPGVEALYYQSAGPYNWSGYRNPDYDAALLAGDEAAAQAALRRDPPGATVLRLERMAAIDARLADATLGEWGTLETLPDWKVAR